MKSITLEEALGLEPLIKQIESLRPDPQYSKLDEAMFCARLCREHREWENLHRWLEVAAHEAKMLMLSYECQRSG